MFYDQNEEHHMDICANILKIVTNWNRPYSPCNPAVEKYPLMIADMIFGVIGERLVNFGTISPYVG